MKYFIYIIFLAYVLHSCKPDSVTNLDDELFSKITEVSETQSPDFFIMPAEDDFDKIPQDPKNLLTSEKVELGKLLIHETAFAHEGNFAVADGTYSCASCHHAAAGFQSGLRQGLGEGGLGFGTKGELRIKNPLCETDLIDVQPIRTPSAMNGAYQEITLWNGQFGAGGLNTGTEAQWKADTPIETNFLGFEGLETQAIAGLGVLRLKVTEELVVENGYKALFDAAFDDVPTEERYTKITAGLAIAAYERTLLSNQAPFQNYLNGDFNALTDNQKEGALLFFGKANCVSCHTGPALNNMQFYALGMKDFDPNEVFRYNVDDAARFGRFSFTNVESDKYKFKTPQLYNLKDVEFLGHGASFDDLEKLLWYKNKGIRENVDVPESQLAAQFQPLNLNNDELEKIADFISNGLHDNNLERFVPASLPSGNCFPNNDNQSQVDLGCQ